MKPRLGQHFLKNKRAVQKIISALALEGGETVIEIGAGKGALTLPLAESCAENLCRLIAIEKDAALAETLRDATGSWKNIEVVHADVLNILSQFISERKLENRNWKLVGNIPYYITGKLLRVISELPARPATSVLMVQREVAERIVAVPPRMNLLAAAVQAWAHPKIILRLAPQDFSPPPEVASAVIALETRPDTAEASLPNYYAAIRKIFKQPRKTILNNLVAGYENKAWVSACLERLDLDGSLRPQNLSLHSLRALVHCLEEGRELH